MELSETVRKQRLEFNTVRYPKLSDRIGSDVYYEIGQLFWYYGDYYGNEGEKRKMRNPFSEHNGLHKHILLLTICVE